MCGTAVVRDEGAVRHYCPNPSARPASRRSTATSRAAAGWTSRARAGRCSSSCSQRGLVKRRGDFFRLTVEDLVVARPVRAQERREPVRGDPAVPAPAARARPELARASRRSAGRRRSTWRAGSPARCPPGDEPFLARAGALLERVAHRVTRAVRGGARRRSDGGGEPRGVVRAMAARGRGRARGPGRRRRRARAARAARGRGGRRAARREDRSW